MKVSDLRDYKKNLYGSLSRELSDFEKNFMLIAGAILTFSVTFIKDLVNIETAQYILCLFIAWSLIAISVGLMMFTFVWSSNSSDAIWKITDDFLIKINKFDSN